MNDTPKLESIHGNLYKGYVTVEVTEATSYILIPPKGERNGIAIPVSPMTEDSYKLVAARLGDWSLPESTKELPTCSLKVLSLCLSSYDIIPVLKEKVVVKPIEVLSPMEEEAIRDSKKRQSYISAKKTYVTADITL